MSNFKTVLNTLIFLLGTTCVHSQIQYINMESTTKWTQGYNGITTIKVYWENPSPDNYTQRQWVKEAIAGAWSKYANIDFVGWEKYDNSGDGVRIYISDTAWPHTLDLGNKINGKYKGMVLNFKFLGKFTCSGHTAESCIKNGAIHEFGHALGLAHEQDKPDCHCAQFPESMSGGIRGGYYVTPCDINSVMNYCNPVWVNDGVLSQYDIQGIQALYGARKEWLGFDGSAGFSSASDKLGPDQIWENLNLNINGLEFIYNLSENNKEEIKTFKFTTSGTYPYSVSSVALHKDNKTYKGYGSGSIYIDKTKNYKIEVIAKNQNYPNFDIVITATDITTGGNLGDKKIEGNTRGVITESNKFLLINGQKPIGILTLTNIQQEKYYVYSNGVIMVHNTYYNTFFQCGQAQAPNYRDWEGKVWTWAFYRGLGNGLQENYIISNTGEVWALSSTSTFSQYGTYVSF